MKLSNWDWLAVLTLLATAVMGVLFTQVYANPQSLLNPFPPPTMPVGLVLPSSTPTQRSLPATWTPQFALPSSTTRPSPEPSTTLTITATLTGTITITPTPSVSPTTTITHTPTVTFTPTRTLARSPTRTTQPTATTHTHTAVPGATATSGPPPPTAIPSDLLTATQLAWIATYYPQTQTQAAIPTYTPTVTPTRTVTSTVTTTPTATETPTPTETFTPTATVAMYSMYFNGDSESTFDRLLINTDGTSANVGADFTAEFWMSSDGPTASAQTVNCGAVDASYRYGITLFDRHRPDDLAGSGGEFGITITSSGMIAYGVTSASDATRPSFTLCSSTNVLDGGWHHVAAVRRGSNGYMFLFVDGSLQASGQGPRGNVAYPGGGGDPGRDPYLVIGANKYDETPADYPPYKGWMDEIRISSSRRYSGSFTPLKRFSPDGTTAVLIHFDEGSGGTAADSSGNGNDAALYGSPSGPTWSSTVP